MGIGPRDELEGMIAAQLLAAHNAAMECYRRAMLGEQTFEGRPNPSPATSFPHLCPPARCPQSPSRKGSAKGHGRARPRQRLAVRLSSVSSTRRKRMAGSLRKKLMQPEQLLMHRTLRCGARTRSGSRAGRRRCAENAAVGCMAVQPEAALLQAIPYKNALRHGHYTAEAIAERRGLAALIRLSRATLADLGKGE